MSRAENGAPPRPPELPPLLRPTGPAALLGLIAAVVGAALRVAIVPAFVTPVFDQVVNRQELGRLPSILTTAGAVALAGALALWAQDALLGRSAASVTRSWRSGLYRRLLHRAPGSLPGSSGGLASRILTDLREVETYFHFGLGTLAAESATVLAILAYLFYTDGMASLLLVGFGVPTLLALRWIGGVLERVAERSQIGTEALGRHLQEGLRHHETVRAFEADAMMLDRFEPENRRTAAAMAQRSLISGAQIPITQVLLFAAVGLLVVVLAGAVHRGAMSAGQLVSFVTLVALLATPTQLLPKGYALLREARAARRRLGVLARPGTAGRPSSDAGCAKPGRGRGLELAAVSFAYDGGPWVLQDLDLELPERGLVAVIGESGSGKTTLLRLLLGFLQPQRGCLWLDGEPLASLAEARLRSRISYVPQGHELLSGPVRENLLMGRALEEPRLWQALAAVGLEATVRGLPRGLDHELQEDGAGFSGGQRQRLAVARALLTEPHVLLLDEPTSSLDASSEAGLVTMLQTQARQRLIVAVAHRPALVSAADEVLVLRGGRIQRQEVKAKPSPSNL